jgi:hypothetical protein
MQAASPESQTLSRMLMPTLAHVFARFCRAMEADEQARSGRASCEKILGRMGLQSLAGREQETEVRLKESMSGDRTQGRRAVGDEMQRDADAEDESRSADAVDDGVLSVGTMSELAVNMNARDAETQDAGHDADGG